MRMTFSSCRIAALGAAFFLSLSVAAQEDNSLLPVPAPDKSPVEIKPSGAADNARKLNRDSYLSAPPVSPSHRCGRGVYSDRCYQIDSRIPRDVSELFSAIEFVECRSAFNRPGVECISRVLYR